MNRIACWFAGIAWGTMAVWNIQAAESLPLTVRSVVADKLLYDTGMIVTVAVHVANSSDTEQSGELQVRLAWEIDEGVVLKKEPVSLKPKATNTFVYTWPSIGVLGCEAVAELYQGGKLVSQQRDLFNVTDPKDALQVGIHTGSNPNGQAITNKYNYCNIVEYLGWDRDPMIGLTPKGEEWRGYYVWNTRSAVLKDTHNPYGKKVLPYTICMTLSSVGDNYYLRHPDNLIYQQLQHPMDVSVKNFDYDARRPFHKSGNPGITMRYALNFSDPEIIDFLSRHIIESTTQFGWSGIRFDGHYLLASFTGNRTFDGKTFSQKEIDEINPKNTRLTKEKVWKAFPDFLFYYNGAPYEEKGPGQESADQAEMYSRGSCCGCEIGRNVDDPNNPFNKWSEAYQRMVLGVNASRKYGGYYSYIVPYIWGHKNPKLDRYTYAMLFAAGGHPWFAQPFPDKRDFPDDPDIVPRNVIPFFKMVTRYSAILWGKGLTRVPDAESWITVKAPGNKELWWKQTVDTRTTLGGKKIVIVNIVNKPPSEMNMGAKQELPESVKEVEVCMTPKGGQKIVKAWNIWAQPEVTPEMGCDELQVKAEGGKYTVTVPTIECARTVVAQLQ